MIGVCRNFNRISARLVIAYIKLGAVHIRIELALHQSLRVSLRTARSRPPLLNLDFAVLQFSLIHTTSVFFEKKKTPERHKDTRSLIAGCRGDHLFWAESGCFGESEHPDTEASVSTHESEKMASTQITPPPLRGFFCQKI